MAVPTPEPSGARGSAAPPPIAVIVGPTGAGKSELAIRLAERVGGEIVSADSQQVYRGMDIGTGKVGESARQRVPHHLLDVVNPDDTMTAALYADLADRAIAEIAARGRAPVIVGGTGLYVRALTLGLFDAPPADEALRARLKTRAEREGRDALWRDLNEVDPESAEAIHPADRIRLTRALEIYELTGETPSARRRRCDHRRAPLRYPAEFVALAPERRELDARIEARVDEMMEAGLLREVEALRAAGYAPPLRSQRAIGYAELHRYLDAELDLGEAVNLIKRNSRRYARRQLSWYRGDARVHWHRRASEVDLGRLERYLRRSPDDALWPRSS